MAVGRTVVLGWKRSSPTTVFVQKREHGKRSNMRVSTRCASNEIPQRLIHRQTSVALTWKDNKQRYKI